MIFGKYPNIIYAVSTADDGNMSFVRGDPKEALANRKKFLAKNGIDVSQAVTLSLVHGINIIRVSKKDCGQGNNPEGPFQEADGMVTNEPGVFLYFLTADCLPIAIYDPVKKAVGLFHAGRIGLYKGMAQEAVRSMRDNFGSKPADLVVTIGPSIGPCHYATVFSELHRHHINFVDYSTNEEWKPYVKVDQNMVTLDLWKFTEDKLKEQGVRSENIENQQICTYENKDYFSHRRFENEKLANDYRFATVLGIKNE